MVMKDPTTRRSRWGFTHSYYDMMVTWEQSWGAVIGLCSMIPNKNGKGHECHSFLILFYSLYTTLKLLLCNMMIPLILLLIWNVNINYNNSCRGFGFVTFADPSSVDKVLTNGPHELDGKKVRRTLETCFNPLLTQLTLFFFVYSSYSPPRVATILLQIDPKIAFPKRAHPKVWRTREEIEKRQSRDIILMIMTLFFLPHLSFLLFFCSSWCVFFSLPSLFSSLCLLLWYHQMVTRTKKVFVGGLSAPTTLEDVKNYFLQFGRVSHHHIISFVLPVMNQECIVIMITSPFSELMLMLHSFNSKRRVHASPKSFKFINTFEKKTDFFKCSLLSLSSTFFIIC